MDARELSARPRPGPLRCAWCHDLLVSEEGEVCPGCATRLHAGCVLEASRCPTLGCARRPRHRVTVGPPGVSWLFLARAAALLLPVVCFAVNEAVTVGRHPVAAHLPWADTYGELWSPACHRPLYPALLWALVARAAALVGRRSGWIEAGLEGGVALAGLFALVYLPVLPLSLVLLVVFGLGLLGFGPLLALAGFVGALRRYRAARPEGEAPRSRDLARALFVLAAAAGLWAGLLVARPLTHGVSW
jgi:hypothetical protein